MHMQLNMKLISNQNRGPKNIVKTIVQQEKIPAVLADDSSPTLSGDLNGNGKSITNLSDIQTEKINGMRLMDLITTALKDVQDWAVKHFSLRSHKHTLEEIGGMEEYVKQKVSEYDGDLKYAKKQHKHDIKDVTGIMPLSIIEKGKELDQLLQKEFAPLSHTHPEISDIVGLGRGGLGVNLKKANGLPYFKDGTLSFVSLPSAEVTKGDLSSLEERVQELINRAISLIPTPEKEDTEVTLELRFSQHLLVPVKCDGKVLVSKVCRNIQGNNASDCSIAKNGEAFDVGDTVRSDDVLTFTPTQHCLVRLVFR